MIDIDVINQKKEKYDDLCIQYQQIDTPICEKYAGYCFMPTSGHFYAYNETGFSQVDTIY